MMQGMAQIPMAAAVFQGTRLCVWHPCKQNPPQKKKKKNISRISPRNQGTKDGVVKGGEIIF